MARAAARYPPESETEDGEEERGRYGSDRGPRPKNKRSGSVGAEPPVVGPPPTLAVLAGVHSIVACLLKRFRGNDDAMNAGIAGCCTGLAFSVPGSPGVLLESCLSFGTFSFPFQGLIKNQDANGQWR